MLRKIYTPKETPMYVAAAMSGSGTNLTALLEDQKEQEKSGVPLSQIVAIITDNRDEGNNAWKIADKYEIKNVLYSDFREFRDAHIKDPKNIEERVPYFEEIVDGLKAIKPVIDWVVFCGYERVVTRPFIGFRPIINVHPADLSKRDANGNAIFTGDNAVLRSILAGESEIRSSTHIVVEGVDQGPVLFISDPVEAAFPSGVTLEGLRKDRELAKRTAKELQNVLKRVGDHPILKESIRRTARGEFARDEAGIIHLNSQPIPNGIRISELVRR